MTAPVDDGRDPYVLSSEMWEKLHDRYVDRDAPIRDACIEVPSNDYVVVTVRLALSREQLRELFE